MELKLPTKIIVNFFVNNFDLFLYLKILRKNKLNNNKNSQLN